jgi:hypothetical protein
MPIVGWMKNKFRKPSVIKMKKILKIKKRMITRKKVKKNLKIPIKMRKIKNLKDWKKNRKKCHNKPSKLNN